jgi:hypothetical protein
MTSGSFQIQSDSINVGGGFGSSTNYTVESTAGEIATGDGASTNYSLRAGYQQMQEVYLSMSAIDDVVMAPSIGLAGGTSSGTASFLILTDSLSGYTVTVAAEANPALRSGVSSIANYVPAGAVPDFTFTTGSSEAFFGFTPEGSDIVARYKDNGAACGVGGLDTVGVCWDTLATTSRTIVTGTSANHPSGATTTLRFRVTAGAGAGVIAGSYAATTTVTALPL